MPSLPSFLVALLCGWFAALVGRQFLSTRRANLFFWMLSLIFSCFASLAYSITLWTQPHSAFTFRMYYLLGAMWMPALMGLGSIALVCGRRWLIVITIVVAVVGIFGSVLLLRAHLSAAALTSLDGGAGDGVLQAGAWLAPLISLNSFGALAVFVVAVLSALKKFRQRAEGRFFYGNLWLAIGILIISAAGSAARLGWPQSFWVTMLIGWIVTFAGYRMLSRPAELPRQTVASDVGLWS